VLSEELLRQQLWDELSGGLDVRQLLRDDPRDEVKPGFASWITRSLRWRGSGPSSTAN